MGTRGWKNIAGQRMVNHFTRLSLYPLLKNVCNTELANVFWMGIGPFRRKGNKKETSFLSFHYSTVEMNTSFMICYPE